MGAISSLLASTISTPQNAGEAPAPRRSQAVDERSRHLPAERREEQRAAPIERREHGADEQLIELAAAVGAPVPERRVVEARPHAAAIGHDEDHAALGRQHAPHLAQQVPRAVGHLEAMHGEQPVDRTVGERQAVVVDQHRLCEAPSRGQRTAPWLSGISAPRRCASPRKAPR